MKWKPIVDSVKEQDAALNTVQDLLKSDLSAHDKLHAIRAVTFKAIDYHEGVIREAVRGALASTKMADGGAINPLGRTNEP